MKVLIRCLSAMTLVPLLSGAFALADIRIDLIKGKRPVKDSVSFTIDVSHETKEDPRYSEKPEFIEISAAFANPASGAIALDGAGVQRFDTTTTVQGQRTEITYGRHKITLQVNEPAVATSLVAFVRGAVVREVIGESVGGTKTGGSMNLDERVAELERRVKQLESEVETIKRARRNQ